jgi:3-methyl-2-oxobutanoate hydroxymethyltransferase
MVEAGVAKTIRDAISVPLIGIGSGDHCDGQIRVVTDLLGLGHGKVPSFTKVYADLGKATRRALAAYAKDVRSHRS